MMLLPCESSSNRCNERSKYITKLGHVIDLLTVIEIVCSVILTGRNFSARSAQVRHLVMGQVLLSYYCFYFILRMTFQCVGL